MLKENTKATDFTLSNQFGEPVNLHDFLGQTIVLYFYPKDDTPGCTKEACTFVAAYEGFKNRNITVIGISKDSVKSHQKFAEKYQLPFQILADPDLTAIQAYDVWQEKKLYGKTYMGIVRCTYIIDETGMIKKVYEKVTPASHAQDILNDLEAN